MTPETLPSIWVHQDDVERARGGLEKVARPHQADSDEDQGDEDANGGQPADEDVPGWGIVSRTVGLLVSWAVCVALGVWIVSALRYGLVEFFAEGKELGEVVALLLALLVEFAGMGIVLAGFYLVTRAYVRALRGRRRAG